MSQALQSQPEQLPGNCQNTEYLTINKKHSQLPHPVIRARNQSGITPLFLYTRTDTKVLFY